MSGLTTVMGKTLSDKKTKGVNVEDKENDIFIQDESYVRVKVEAKNKTGEFTVPIDLLNGHFAFIPDDEYGSILKNSKIITNVLFDTCIMVALRLPNGFVLVETYNLYEDEDVEKGLSTCIKRIYNRINGVKVVSDMYNNVDNVTVENIEHNHSCEKCPHADYCPDNPANKTIE